MRAIDCPLCGQHAEAKDDDELFAAARRHVDEKHPDQTFTDDQLRAQIAQNGKTV